MHSNPVPSMRLIIERRHLATSLIRGSGFVLFVTSVGRLTYQCMIGLYHAAAGMEPRFGAMQRDYSMISGGNNPLVNLVWSDLGRLVLSTFMLCVFAFLLSRFAIVIANWIVPLPTDTLKCLRCKYVLTNLKTPRCPECGCAIAMEYVEAEEHDITSITDVE